jgi:peptidoglycan/LPS O-acetylase OafA/YrhL
MGLLWGAFYAVDTFLWLTGVLTSFLLLSEIAQRKGRLSWVMIYVHRVWRILPVYAFVLIVTWKALKVFMSGPFLFKEAHISAE